MLLPKLIDFSAQVTYEKAAAKYCKCPPASYSGWNCTFMGKALGLCFLVDLRRTGPWRSMGVSLGMCVHVLSGDMDPLVSDPVHLFILVFISA